MSGVGTLRSMDESGQSVLFFRKLIDPLKHNETTKRKQYKRLEATDALSPYYRTRQR